MKNQTTTASKPTVNQEGISTSGSSLGSPIYLVRNRLCFAA